MDTGLVLALVIIAVIALVGVGIYLYYQQQRRSQRLRRGFGSEYDKAVSEKGSRREAEKELEERQKRVERLHLRELRPEERSGFAQEWQETQAHFVDDPTEAIGQADELVSRVMEARGYPMADFEQRASDISVDHPDVVRNYRAAHSIAEKNDRGDASTEDLRQAMVHYRSLFEDLLGTPARAGSGGSR
jgi:hypothetical protein